MSSEVTQSPKAECTVQEAGALWQQGSTVADLDGGEGGKEVQEEEQTS